MEDLTKNWNNLSLSEKEDPGDGSRGSYLQATLEICEWFQRPKFGRSYSAFCFDNSSDVERIFQNQPWSFDKHLVVLQKFDEYSKLKDLVFDKALFWVQVHDIQIHFISKRVAESICDIMGEVQRSPESTDDDGGNFIRVRVTIDINLPLCRGRVITLENGEKSDFNMRDFLISAIGVVVSPTMTSNVNFGFEAGY